MILFPLVPATPPPSEKRLSPTEKKLIWQQQWIVYESSMICRRKEDPEGYGSFVVYCICIAVSCSGHIAVSAPTTMTIQQIKINFN